MKPIYLDNAATSHPKPETVYQAVMDALRHGGSAGRGSYQLAQSTSRLIFETRELLAELFHAPDSDRFVFTANATIAINQALFGLLKKGDRVVTTSIEHNAVARPLRLFRIVALTLLKLVRTVTVLLLIWKIFSGNALRNKRGCLLSIIVQMWLGRFSHRNTGSMVQRAGDLFHGRRLANRWCFADQL